MAGMWSGQRGKWSAEAELEGSSRWLQCLRFCFVLLSGTKDNLIEMVSHQVLRA